MLNEKLKDIIEEVLRKHVKEYQNSEVENDKNIARVIYTAIRESGLVCNSWKSLEEQELNIYSWTAIENDGYTHGESGVAMNMFDAFIEATEHSPSYHKYIEIERVEKEDYTDAHKELLDWYKGGSEK
jgi:hypothetical protein